MLQVNNTCTLNTSYITTIQTDYTQSFLSEKRLICFRWTINRVQDTLSDTKHLTYLEKYERYLPSNNDPRNVIIVKNCSSKKAIVRIFQYYTYTYNYIYICIYIAGMWFVACSFSIEGSNSEDGTNTIGIWPYRNYTNILEIINKYANYANMLPQIKLNIRFPYALGWQYSEHVVEQGDNLLQLHIFHD